MANASKSSISVSINTEAIDKIVGRIVELVHPLRIILFGSVARDDTGSDSDIDLLVVMPEGVHRRKTAQFLYQHIVGIKIPFDLVVATSNDLEKHKENLGLIYRSALREGKEVYAA
ncbi:MAG TPA: nucleotidyltransferase domain-containing protein [Candidatus Brocadiaceae bacterium]|nr:nucleotidyltransferase domain-containing protein [Candidatus Brocadiaceae bacterium]